MSTTKFLGFLVLALFCLGPGGLAADDPIASGKPAPSEQDLAVAAAVEAAQKWLASVDEGKFDESWEAAATMFRNAITKEQWSQSLTAIRTPMGKMLTRTAGSSTYRTEVPGAPDGHYVIIQFNTTFENKKQAVETVTPMKEPDGSWKVSGYYIN